MAFEIPLIFVVLLAIDLLAVSAASALANSHTRVMVSLDAKEKQPSRFLFAISSTAYGRASLHIVQTAARFAMAGLVGWAVTQLVPANQAPGGILLALALGALLVAWLEWLVEDNSKNQPAWAARLAPFIRFWNLLLYPLVFLTLRSSNINGAEPVSNAGIENEVKSLVDAGQQEGVFEQDERKMIYSIFRLGNTLVREIMVPRIDISAIEVETLMEDAVDHLLKSGFSRVPVYQETVDNILGVLYTKDLLGVWHAGQMGRSLQSLLRPAYFVPEAKKVDELLAEMQNQRVHMAVIVDEYGGVAGLVTLEDIVEEIVGEIQDEFDQAEESPYQEISSTEYIFLGRVDLDDFNELMTTSLPREEADTLGGFIYNRMGRVPLVGENLTVNNVLLEVEQVTGRRIRKVRAQILPATPVEKKEEELDDNHRSSPARAG